MLFKLFLNNINTGLTTNNLQEWRNLAAKYPHNNYQAYDTVAKKFVKV
jgi:hypothetical protein